MMGRKYEEYEKQDWFIQLDGREQSEVTRELYDAGMGRRPFDPGEQAEIIERVLRRIENRKPVIDGPAWVTSEDYNALVNRMTNYEVSSHLDAVMRREIGAERMSLQAAGQRAAAAPSDETRDRLARACADARYVLSSRGLE